MKFYIMLFLIIFPVIAFSQSKQDTLDNTSFEGYYLYSINKHKIDSVYSDSIDFFPNTSGQQWIQDVIDLFHKSFKFKVINSTNQIHS